MNKPFDCNRVILCHFDTYSAALLFARFGDSVLLASPLQADASVAAPPAECGEEYAPARMLDALERDYGFDVAQWTCVEGFQEWRVHENALTRIHLLRYTGFEAPHAELEPLGAAFKPISLMRGTPMVELNLLRQAFNLFLG